MNSTESPVLPQNCLIGFTIPFRQEDFFRQATDAQKYFIRQCCSSWAKYKSEIIDVCHTVVPAFENLGGKIHHELTSLNWPLCFNDDIKLIILIAHWHEDSIEFYDRVITCDEVTEAIPFSFDGVIDLCVCTSEKLATTIKNKRPNCSVRYTTTKSSLSYWLSYYDAFFKYVSVKPVPYNQAYADVTTEFLKQL